MDGKQAAESVLSHFGVKGMRWGQTTKATRVSVSQKGKKLKTAGGEGQKAHPDAIRKATLARTKKKSGVNALSDQELSVYANRLQLEERVKGLEYSQKSAGKKFALSLIGQTGKTQLQNIANDQASKQVKRAFAASAARKATSVAVGAG